MDVEFQAGINIAIKIPKASMTKPLHFIEIF